MKWLTAAASRRFSAWMLRRLPLSDQLTLTQRNVYIVPSRPGWMLAVTLAVMLVGSINYQLNLGYVLTFMLAGSALVGMHVGHATLQGLSLRLAPPPPCHAGGAAQLAVALASQRTGTRWGIGLGLSGQPVGAFTDVPPQGQAQVNLGWEPPGRGRHAVPPLVVETRFPLGTFRVWAVWRPAATVLVYPQAELHPPPLPPGSPRPGTAGVAPATPSGEFDGVRAYRRGDPLKAVVWKRVAQAQARGSQELVSRDHASAQQHELWLDWTQTGLPAGEARWSRLCAWVLRAERLGLDYGLRLPGRELAPAQGAAHLQQCLEALALC